MKELQMLVNRPLARPLVGLLMVATCLGIVGCSASSSGGSAPAGSGTTSSAPAENKLTFSSVTGSIQYSSIGDPGSFSASGTIAVTKDSTGDNVRDYGQYSIGLTDGTSPGNSISISGLPEGTTKIVSASAAPSPIDNFEISVSVPTISGTLGYEPVYDGWGQVGANSKGYCTVDITQTGNGPAMGVIACPSLESITSDGSVGSNYSLHATFTATP